MRAGAADAAGSFSLYAAARARRLQAVLDVVELSQDVVELSQALERARSLAVPAEVLEPAVLRLVKLEEEHARTQRRRCEAIAMDACRSEAARARLRTLGLPDEAMRVPLEFLCPITPERMVDPVVASDGHSYEREAISHVLYRSSGLSPLTRERLRHELFPNIALRKAISEYETEAAGLLERFLEAQHGALVHATVPPNRRCCASAHDDDDADVGSAAAGAVVAAIAAGRGGAAAGGLAAAARIARGTEGGVKGGVGSGSGGGGGVGGRRGGGGGRRGGGGSR